MGPDGADSDRLSDLSRIARIMGQKTPRLTNALPIERMNEDMRHLNRHRFVARAFHYYTLPVFGSHKRALYV